MKVALNLGCGNDYRASSKERKWVNADNLADFPGARVDKNVDLNRIPYPFKSGYADEVFMNHVLEHLEDPRAVMKEVHRVLKSGGLFFLNVPYFTRGYSVHVHTKGFSVWSVLEDTRQEFVSEKVQLLWDYPENFRRGAFILRPFCRFWNWVINRNHFLTERFLCYKFGGILEARFVLRKK
ncbi:MAG: class I SAM-dependent methyltransferase [Candidatus Aenigmarchaeota archaeon]|nr:class I SAM-dependent methyltransferase [Candidatus Aenigmarchaeota archaeon]